MGCSGGGYPISVEVTVPLAEAYSIETYGAVEPGHIVTPDMPIPPVPFCALPDRGDIEEMIRGAVGGVVAGMLDLDRLEVIAIEIEAVEGDFNTLTELSLHYEPKPVLGVEQPAIDLGETSAEAGLGAAITLQPPETVDFFDLIENNDANPAPGCPELHLRLRGTVPAVTPRWSISVKVRVVGHIDI
jgi:hypothetical protein